MRRYGLVMVGSLLVSCCLWAGTASSQEETTTTIVAAPETTTTTTTVEETTTTVAPETTTTTTAAPAPTTTVDYSGVTLPGRVVTSGRLGLDIGFKDHPESDCNTNLDLAGGSLNVVDDEEGNIGASYGEVHTDSTTGRAGVLVVKLGALPAAIAVITVTGPCNIDTIGVGNYDAGTDYAKFDGVGVGVKSSNIADGMFAERMKIDETIGGTGNAANLDLHQLEDLIMRPRS